MTGLTFDEADHVYTLDGARVPSVTQVLHGAGLIDFGRIPPFVLEQARARGAIVHRAIHYYNENDLDVAEFTGQFPDYAGYLEAWIAFRRERRFVPLINECRVASRRHGVAGTLDCLGTLDELGVLIDFKTGRPADVSADLQTAAYLALALEWQLDDDILRTFLRAFKYVRRFAVQLRRDGSFVLEPYAEASDMREFLILVDARHVVDKRRGRATWEGMATV